MSFSPPDESQIMASKSMKEVLAIQEFWNVPTNRVQFQFPLPESRYGWQNIGRLYNTVDALRGGPVKELPVEINEAIGDMKFVNKDGQMETVNEHLDPNKYPVDAMMVVHKGKIVFEKYNTMRPCDKHIWMSCGKVTGSTIMAIFEAQGKIDVQKPVSYYLEELKGSEWDNTTIEQMLDMSNGLDSTEHDEEKQDSRTNPDRTYYQFLCSIGLLPDRGQKTHDQMVIISQMKRKYPGHTKFEYNSINTFLMNRINERIGGKPINELLSEMIWSKLGMEHDMTVAISPQGYPLTFGMMAATLRDMAKFGMAFTPSASQIASAPVVPESVVKLIQTTGKPEIYDKGYVGQKMLKTFTGDTGLTNRYMWDAIFPDGCFMKGGVGGQGLLVFPEKDAVVCYFSTGDGNQFTEAMARAILKQL